MWQVDWHPARLGPCSSPTKKGAQLPSPNPLLLWPNGRPSQLLQSTCKSWLKFSVNSDSLQTTVIGSMSLIRLHLHLRAMMFSEPYIAVVSRRVGDSSRSPLSAYIELRKLFQSRHFKMNIIYLTKHCTSLIMAALRSRCGHYILPGGFYLPFPRLLSAVPDWMPTILPHIVWP